MQGSWTNPSAITVNGGTLSLNGTWTNNATITATNSTLNVGDASNKWSNPGTINATDSTVNLGGVFTLTNLGTFHRTGGTVNLVGTLDLLPVAPSGLSAVASTDFAILRWSDNSTVESGYKVERSTNGVNFTPLGTVEANVTSYFDTGLTAGTTYYYRVRAYNAVGDSLSYSNVASATPGQLGGGLLVSYYNSTDLSGPAVLTQLEPTIDDSWYYYGGSPGNGVNGSGNFSGRWLGQLQAPSNKTYTFDAQVGGSVKVWVNGQLVANTQDSDPVNNQVAIVAGQRYNIRVDYRATYYGPGVPRCGRVRRRRTR